MSLASKPSIHLPDLAGQRVVVAMSGGVDSSVTTALLAEHGAEAIGVSMHLFGAGDTAPPKGCCSPDDAMDARSVAAKLEIPFYVVDYEAEFATKIIGNFVDEYRSGRTPSPCVLCNNYLKFDTLLSLADSLGATRLATGHYARIEEGDSGYRLLRGVDRRKDQSYFLFGIKRDVLPRILFPLGGLEKSEVRELAAGYGLPTASKAESQDLCFVSGANYLEFLEKHLDDEDRVPGEIVHVESGRVLGNHEGIHRYTIGQRRGLGVGGSDGPLYVIGLSERTGQVFVGSRESLRTAECTLSGCNWLAFESLVEPIDALVQVRYRHEPVPACVEPISQERARVVFATPEEAVAPGQAAVVYWDQEVVGGGWIDSPR